MADLAAIETDDALENEGVETTLESVPGDPPARFRLRGIGAHGYHFALLRYQREVRLEGQLDGEAAQREAYCRTVASLIADWSGLTDRGADYPYSPERAREFVRRVPRARDEVFLFAWNGQHYRSGPAYDLRQDEGALGNSEPPSPGATPGAGETSNGSEI